MHLIFKNRFPHTACELRRVRVNNEEDARELADEQEEQENRTESLAP